MTQPSINPRPVCQHRIILPWLYAVADDLSPRNKHRLGEIAEARFVAKAEDLNFAVAKPWSTRNRYDFIVDSGKRLWRIQLKCTNSLYDGAYQVKAACRIAGQSARSYTPEEIDYIVAYVVPRDIWYVIPLTALKGKIHLRLHPEKIGRHKPKWETYREAWHLLRDPLLA
ncbi:MAG TPA: group I intron-associated PD-(D/E)XK endonuclease [Terriglobales bacterium]|nr:group I intron-associated PD-(D/E)XK endonuclease [Terriglobales bacterium]